MRLAKRCRVTWSGLLPTRAPQTTRTSLIRAPSERRSAIFAMKVPPATGLRETAAAPASSAGLATRAATTAVGSECAVDDPLGFVAVTTARKVAPASVSRRTKVESVAPATYAHVEPTQRHQR